MIAAHKYLNLNLSVLSLGGMVIELMKEDTIVKYDDLLQRLILARGEKIKDVFVPTLSFLYLLGKIEYRNDIDSIEFLR